MPEWLPITNIAIGLIATVIGGAVGIIMWIVRARSGITKEISTARLKDRELTENLAGRLAHVEREILSVKERMKDLPTSQDLQRLHHDMIEMRGSMNLIGEQMRSLRELVDRVERIVIRHEEHLLRRPE